jgi:hypothetical protein
MKQGVNPAVARVRKRLHCQPIEALLSSDVLFFVGRKRNGTAIATAALKLHHGWAKVKRVWVEPLLLVAGILNRLCHFLS